MQYDAPMQHTLLAAMLVVAACGSGSTQGPSANTAASGSGSGSNLICKEETPTGSHFSREVCRTPEQVEDDRKDADDLLRRQRSRPTK
jgi:hypothetical protein